MDREEHEAIFDALLEQFPDIGLRFLEAGGSTLYSGAHGDTLYPPHLMHFTAMIRAIGGDTAGSITGFRPGEHVLVPPGEDPVQSVTMAVPVPHNVWYLSLTENLLDLLSPSDGESLMLSELIDTLFARCGEVDCLRQHFRWQDAVDGVGRYSIKAARLESWNTASCPRFPSEGPNVERALGKAPASLWKQFCGYLAFPLGPLGVMEYLTVVSEGMLDDRECVPGHEVHEGGGAVQVFVLDGLLSPKERMEQVPAGVVLIEKGYLMEHGDLEYPAADFSGQDPLYYHKWCRLYLRGENKWPVPGEFVGMLAQPWPYQVWWHQQTCPFMYSGNWFDTAAYTSGKVVSKIEPEDVDVVNGQPSVEEAPLYVVKIHGIEVVVRTTDFRAYEIGEKVAIVRRDVENRAQISWLEIWNGVAYYEAMRKDLPPKHYDVCEDFLIAPVIFYTR